MDQLITNIITNLPNFAGLIFALIVVMRNNEKLTNALIDMAKHCNSELDEIKPIPESVPKGQ